MIGPLLHDTNNNLMTSSQYVVINKVNDKNLMRSFNIIVRLSVVWHYYGYIILCIGIFTGIFLNIFITPEEL
jgi:hypothetical protein